MKRKLIDPRRYPKLPDYMEVITEPVPEGWRAVIIELDDDGARTIVDIAEADTRAEAIYYASAWAIQKKEIEL
jgi:hypothetical protein